MILRMESSLMRTLKTKDHLCYEATRDSDIEPLRTKSKRGTVKWIGYLAVAAEVSREAQEGILGSRQETKHPGWSRKASKILVVGQCLHRRELHCLDE
jgi:hypothetical protein